MISTLSTINDFQRTAICNTIRRQFDRDYNGATKCWKFKCQDRKKKRYENFENLDFQSSSTMDITLGEEESTGIPIWVYIIAGVGGALLFLALVVLIIVLIWKPKREQWSQYDAKNYEQV